MFLARLVAPGSAAVLIAFMLMGIDAIPASAQQKAAAPGGTVMMTNELQALKTVDSTIGEAKQLLITYTEHGSMRLTFQAGSGLYQYSVIADASAMDWEELYVVLNQYNNVGKRSGPWDFNPLDKNRPLVPAYWVTLDGERIGLWFFQRVSLEDIANTRFRGRMAFHLQKAGEHVLELTPYRDMPVRWMSALLEVDPEDTMEPLTVDLEEWEKRALPSQFADQAYWDAMRERLATTHAVYAEPLRKGLGGSLPMLAAAYRMEGRQQALGTALGAIDGLVARKTWGNPQEDGYSHNGDMGAAEPLLQLAIGYRAFYAELGEERRARMREKMRLQGEIFMELALLNRDYWGGSVIQDHGWRAMWKFGAASIYLLGVLPEAERWTAYMIPRLRRSVQALPRDGVIPMSSYLSVELYLDDLCQYRIALQALTGEDIFDQAPFHAIIDYLLQVTRTADKVMLLEHPLRFTGGNLFLNMIADKYHDGRAAALQQWLLDTGSSGNLGVFWGCLSYNPAVTPTEELPAPQKLALFPDNGLAHYRDLVDDVTLSVRCGPFAGYNAYRKAQGPCDRMSMAPGAGHFTLFLGADQRLASPDTGYSLTSAVRTCLLVDGRGQADDVGYPMSIPSRIDRGEEIVFARWDQATNTGWVRLNLAPAYPEDMGITVYTRDFLFYPGEKIICRDRVVADKPHIWTWLFQGRRDDGLELDGLAGLLGKEPALRITPLPLDLSLTARVAQTEVVYSYSSKFSKFDHIRYDTTQPTQTAQIDFILTWK